VADRQENGDRPHEDHKDSRNCRNDELLEGGSPPIGSTTEDGSLELVSPPVALSSLTIMLAEQENEAENSQQQVPG
jgi:hypothetical protein